MVKNENQDDEKFRLFYERSPLGYQSLDEEGCFLEVNPAWLELFGYSHAEVIGKCFCDFLTHEGQKIFIEGFPRFKAAGETRGVLYNMVHKDGYVIVVEIDGNIGYDKENHFQQTHCVLHDVTERRKIEEKLLKSEKQLQIRNRILEIFLSFPDEQMYAELLNVILDTLESDFGTFGYFNEEGTFFCPSMTREIYWGKCDVADKEIIFEMGTFGGIWGRAIKERKTFYDNKGPFIMPKGHIPIKNTIAAPIIYKGDIISAIHVANKSTEYNKQDVELIEIMADNIAPVLFARLDRDRKEKEHKKMESELKRAVEIMESAEKTANAGSWRWDVKTNKVKWSDNLCNLWGIDPDDFGETFDYALPLIHPDDIERIKKDITEMLAEKKPRSYEYRIVTPDGVVKYLQVTNQIHLDDKGEITELTGMSQDITERKKAEVALQDAHDELEKRVIERTSELMAAQDQLIRTERLAATGQLAASIAHEINSPLQAITVLLGTMKSKHKEDKELLDNIDLLKGAFTNIRNTVKNLMDLNRPGKERKQLTNVNSIIENTVALMKSHLKKNKVKIDLNLSSTIPDMIASPQQLGHVFLNLINNAVEAMSGISKSEGKWKERTNIGGEILIKSMLKKDKVIIQVSDTGPGISEDDLEHIFDSFFTKKKTMGMGVGLSICNGILEDHNGTIEARNAKDGGAVFTVTLPFKKG